MFKNYAIRQREICLLYLVFRFGNYDLLSQPNQNFILWLP